jgi:hypothetical protein
MTCLTVINTFNHSHETLAKHSEMNSHQLLRHSPSPELCHPISGLVTGFDIETAVYPIAAFLKLFLFNVKQVDVEKELFEFLLTD